ncbi:hypothetical protein ES703_117195 [subsurface metagenome]
MARPAAFTLATVLSLLLQATVAVIIAQELSEYVALALNCWVLPAATDLPAGVTAIDCNSAAVTVSSEVSLSPYRVAVMLAAPATLPVVVARTLGLTTTTGWSATVGLELVHVALLVTSTTEPSV